MIFKEIILIIKNIIQNQELFFRNKKDILDNQYYGDITNKNTLVSFVISGGSNDMELQDRMDSSDDFLMNDDDNDGYDDDDDFDEDDDDIIDKENDDENLYNNNEIEVSYNSIKLHNDVIDSVFKVNDFIGLYDELTNEKDIDRSNKKITNLYILVNDIRIPIIVENENTSQEIHFILYKVKSKNNFIDELGNDLLQLYIASEYVTNIYKKYRKNDIFDNLISNINSKIKLYHTQNFNFKFRIITKESINKTIIDDILIVISGSDWSTDNILSSDSILLDTLNTQALDDIYINTDSDDFKIIKKNLLI